MKAYSEQLKPYIKGNFKALGTDGFGRSDSRASLRKFFEVDTNFIVYTTLAELAINGKIDKKVALEAKTNMRLIQIKSIQEMRKE